jgi:hypothetical protein
MPGVFISYRREDSAAYAGRLFDILSTEFGRENTFMDLDTIQGGDDFSVVIERKLDVSDALLAVIGTHWLSVTEPDGGRRLDNASDFVRVEIGKALERGIRVIPVLVGGATLPRPNDLPGNLQPLCERQARPHPVAAGTEKAAQNSGSAPPSAQTGAGGTSASAKPLANVAGEWEATVKYDWGDTYHEWFDFEVDGQELSGTAGFLGVPKGQGRPIWEGKIAGDRISFMTKSLTSLGGDGKTYEDKHYYKGTVKGDEIVFTMVTDSSIESHTPIHFTANRVKNE